MNNIILYTIVLAPIILVRTLRWLSIVQQKEYRFDRLHLFLTTREGIRDLIIPWPISLKRLPQLSDLKRPKITVRVAVVAVISILTILLLFIKLFSLPFIVTAICLYILAPIIILTSIIPTALISNLITLTTLRKAQKILHKVDPMIIGITGSYGKTSTKQLIYQILSQNKDVFVTPKSYNTRYSVAKSICNNYRKQKIAILEYAAYTKGEIKTLAHWFKPAIAVITGIAPQHLGLFGSIEEIVKAKSELIRALPAEGVVFFNGEDDDVCRMVKNVNCKKIDYSKHKSTTKITNLKLDKDAKLSFTYKQTPIQTQLIGCHYITNIKCAISIAEYLNVPEVQIIKGLTSFQPSDNFIHSYHLSSGALVINDGKTSNPAGFNAAIQIIKSLSYPKKVLLTSGVVDLGNKSTEVHEQLALASKSVFNYILYTGEDGITEFKEGIREELYTQKTDIEKIIREFDKDTVLLIEGFIKPDILNLIK